LPTVGVDTTATTSLGAAVGNNVTYNPLGGGTGVAVSAFIPSGTPGSWVLNPAGSNNLGGVFEKVSSPFSLSSDENGLGIANQQDNEINQNQFLQFNISSLTAAAGLLSFIAGSSTTGINCPNGPCSSSTTVNEEFKLFATNTAGAQVNLANLTPFFTCNTGTSSGCESKQLFANILGKFNYLDVEATQGNILVDEIDTQAVPGPIVGAGLPGLVAGCLGLLGLGRYRRRRFASI
jgi:hypothetical protein